MNEYFNAIQSYILVNFTYIIIRTGHHISALETFLFQNRYFQ